MGGWVRCSSVHFARRRWRTQKSSVAYYGAVWGASTLHRTYHRQQLNCFMFWDIRFIPGGGAQGPPRMGSPTGSQWNSIGSVWFRQVLMQHQTVRCILLALVVNVSLLADGARTSLGLPKSSALTHFPLAQNVKKIFQFPIKLKTLKDRLQIYSLSSMHVWCYDFPNYFIIGLQKMARCFSPRDGCARKSIEKTNSFMRRDSQQTMALQDVSISLFSENIIFYPHKQNKQNSVNIIFMNARLGTTYTATWWYLRNAKYHVQRCRTVTSPSRCLCNNNKLQLHSISTFYETTRNITNDNFIETFTNVLSL